MHENFLSAQIVDAAVTVHRELGGPGLLERVYEEALIYELTSRNLMIEQQKSIPIIYRDKHLNTSLRLDLIVESLIIIEIKAVAEYNAIYSAQLLTYLRLCKLRLGLVLNFGQCYMRDGIHRVINQKALSQSSKKS
ncbi:GxxExxY protein [Herpetosiphon giganteus]|uniref:GxxExxY protein n=1 Tax=Herpetosiphon giganteus TaxID=2029754 RepID=UPI0019587648|nr:GxxExxY protein [Herpetosiphon giganteus]MBM7843708.1 GxxExxY protein [Herpetosiphon giganteus]